MRNVASIENEMEGGKYFVHDFEIFENVSQESRDTVALQLLYSRAAVARHYRQSVARLLLSSSAIRSGDCRATVARQSRYSCSTVARCYRRAVERL